MNVRTILRPALFIFAFTLTEAAFGQANSAAARQARTNGIIVLPETVVIGKTEQQSLTSPSAETAAEQKEEIPGGFTIQRSQEMYKGRVSSLADLFQNTPGIVMLSENNVEVSKVFIRGSGVYSGDEPIGVQYLLDGLTLNQADGEIILEDFDVGTIKYAEVYRGADAFQYGALGLGGAVNFVPDTGYDAAPLSVRLEGGSFGFMRGQVTTGGVVGPADYFVSVSGRYRDGWRDHSRENTEMLFSDFGYKLNEQMEDRLYVIADKTDRQIPGGISLEQMQQDPRQAGMDAVQEDFRKDWSYLRLADNLTFQSGGERANAGVYWWHRDAYEPNLYIPDVYLAGINAFYADDYGAMLDSITRSQIFGGKNILTVGFNPTAEGQHDAYYQNLNGQPGAATGGDLQWSLNLVLFGQDQYYLTKRLSLVGGIQAAYAQRHFYDHFNNSVDGDQSDNLIFRTVNPKVGLLYEINDKDQIYANFSRSWQPPSFDDMVDFDTGPNTSQTFTPLSPQYAWTAEIGTRGKAGHFDWELSLYRTYVHGELLDLFNPATDAEIGGVNIPHVIIQGVEAGFNTRLFSSIFVRADKTHDGDSLTLRQDYTFSDLRFSDNPTYGDNRIAGVPPHMYQAQLMYETPGGFYAGPNVNWSISYFPVDNANTLYAPSFALLGFKMGLYLGKGFSIFFDARNLLNERYASSVDPISSANPAVNPPPIQVFHPGDPRSFYGGVAWVW
ncbi:MAG: TonB-dependent receptor family protein [Limisphaerales bacterium]